MILIILLLLYITITSSSTSSNSNDNRNKYITINNKSIYGAIIIDDGIKKTVSTSFKTLSEIAEIDSIISKHNNDTNTNITPLHKLLPITLLQWPSIYTTSCPHYKRKVKVDRGHCYSHYQIWLDFIYYDYDVINAVNNNEVKDVYISTSYSSSSAIFTAYKNGTLYKDGVKFDDNDAIIIFEDNVEIAVRDLDSIIINELKDMNTDILYFGWCQGKGKSNVPLCTHAYAITRRGAKEVVANYNQCGHAIDEQLAHMIKNQYITYKLVNTTKYIDKFYTNYNKDLGLIQKKRKFI
jgi:hypothetical protein